MGRVVKSAVTVAALAAGFCQWGWDFAWVVLGVVLFGRALVGLASFIVSLVCLVGLLWFIFTHIL